MTSKDQGLAGDLAAIRDALLYAQSWICSAPHGDNCYVSSHYEGDPGNQCNCGKEGVEQAVESALATPVATPEPDLPSWLMKEWDGGDEEEYWRISAELERNRLATTATGEPRSYVEDPTRTGVGALCAPGPAAQQRQRWVLRFDDQDCREAQYWDEVEARTAFAKAEARGWNCYLFKLCDRATGEPTDATENAKLREALRPFANYACAEPCDCHNCKAREVLAASKEQQ